MAEKHPDVKFEYSFSDGKYWSPYDHCRVWKNGTYDLMIRDNYGQTAKRVYEETGVVEDTEIPVQINFSDFKDYVGDPIEYYDGIVVCENTGKMTITIQGDYSNPVLYKRIKGQNAWIREGNFNNNKFVLQNPGQAEYYVEDSYGRKSKIFISEVVLHNPSFPQFGIIILHADSGALITEVKDYTETNGILKRYAISYDNGKTWSDWQLGRYFQKLKPPIGTYRIGVKMKYDNVITSGMIDKIVTIQ